MKLDSLLCVLMFLFFISSCQTKMDKPNPLSIPIHIDSLIHQMTLEEKLDMIHASSSFTSGGVKRLGIPELIMSDGPHGVRHEHGRDWAKDENVEDNSTYLPVGVALASTWNRDLGYKFGIVLGSEANYRGKDVILGPGLNIIRSPLNGRNFEYLTEDPYLNSEMVIGSIKGIQEQGIAACAKHYIANTLEYDREHVNVEMSERALREIYLPGFKAAVEKGGVHTIMSAYNKFRGVYCSHSKYLLDDILREELGFEGIVISDWAAVKSTLGAANVGLDIEMGTDLDMPSDNINYDKFFLGDPLHDLIKNGQVKESVVDQKLRRILSVMSKIHKFDKRPPGAYNTKEHQEIARQIANEAIVLLKNENLLPLKKDQVKKLVLVGAHATHRHAGAGGSSQVKATYEVTPMEGLQNLLGDEVSIDHAQGFIIEREWKVDADLINEAVRKVSGADAAIYIGGWIHGYSDDWNDNAYDAEVVDKPDMNLPFGQSELIQAVLKANPNTVVVLFGGGPSDNRVWQHDAKAIVQAWYPGMEGGNALADILFGELNPSGKLPMTFPEKLDDSPAHSVATYPDENLLIDHKDDIYVGYRYFDTYNKKPAFPFGHGLSYTSFEYSDLHVSEKAELVTVDLKVTNTGNMEGAEVVQLYIKDVESRLYRPEKELKGFEKVYLKPGASKTVKIELDRDAFSYYDDTKKTWVLEPGTFEVLIGSSSRDIRLRSAIQR